MEDDYYGNAIDLEYSEDFCSDDVHLHNRRDSLPVLDDFYDLKNDLGKYMRINTRN